MITVNSKILAGHITGVQRYLLEIVKNFPQPVDMVRPANSATGLPGHLWEQFILPQRAGTNLLWSPSNSGPLSARHQVVTIHDMVPLDNPQWLNWKFARFYKFLLPRLVLRVRRIIVISEFTKQRLLATTRAAPDKIVVIPNGVGTDFHPRPAADLDAATAELQLPSRRYLLTVGSLEPRKNLRRLLAAWRIASPRLADDLWLVVAGAKGKSLVFADSTAGEDLPPRTHLTGHIPDGHLAALYSGAQAFAYMSEYEGFGLPPLEAMASGVPVLVSNTTVFPEVVADAGLFASPFDVEDIADKLVRLLSDAELARDLAARGLQRAKNFSWARTAALTHQVLLDAAAEG